MFIPSWIFYCWFCLLSFCGFSDNFTSSLLYSCLDVSIETTVLSCGWEGLTICRVGPMSSYVGCSGWWWEWLLWLLEVQRQGRRQPGPAQKRSGDVSHRTCMHGAFGSYLSTEISGKVVYAGPLFLQNLLVVAVCAADKALAGWWTFPILQWRPLVRSAERPIYTSILMAQFAFFFQKSVL